MLSPVARPSATSTPAPGHGQMCSIYRWSVLVTAARQHASDCTLLERAGGPDGAAQGCADDVGNRAALFPTKAAVRWLLAPRHRTAILLEGSAPGSPSAALRSDSAPSPSSPTSRTELDRGRRAGGRLSQWTSSRRPTAMSDSASLSVAGVIVDTCMRISTGYGQYVKGRAVRWLVVPRFDEQDLLPTQRRPERLHTQVGLSNSAQPAEGFREASAAPMRTPGSPEWNTVATSWRGPAVIADGEVDRICLSWGPGGTERRTLAVGASLRDK